MPEQIRLDKWLWAARFFKTRSLCAQEIDKGRVLLNQQQPKASRDVKPGDHVEVRRGDTTIAVIVQAVSNVRGPAQAAQQLYTETPDSIAARERAAELRRLAPEPARDLNAGRPTKRDRRAIERLRGGQ